MEIALSVESKASRAFVRFIVFVLCASGVGLPVYNKDWLMVGAGLIVFAFLIIFFFRVSGIFETRLLFNDAGITDKRLGVGTIPWREIESAYLEDKYNNQFLCLKLKSPDDFLDRLPQPKKRRMQHHRALGMTVFNISISDLPIEPLDLLDLVRKKIK